MEAVPDIDIPDWCQPLDSPRWLNPAGAVLMRDDDAVLGFEAAGRIWAIPWWVMKNHHVANLTHEGEAFTVTLCENCVAGGVFDPVVDGKRFRFRILGWSGASPMMVDDVTGSWWTLVSAQCLQGPARGIGRLPMRPIAHSTWKEWRAMHPETVVVDGQGEPRDGHGSDCPNPDHAKFADSILPDSPLSPMELVVGVDVGERKCAYRLADLHARGGIFHDVRGGREIVVVTLPGSWRVVAFERELAGSPIALRWEQAADSARHLIADPSGSRFDLWGNCVSGEHEGARLGYVRSALAKWGAWIIDNPDSELWEPTSEASGECPS